MRRMTCAFVVGCLAVTPISSVQAQQLPQTVFVWTGGNSSQDVMMASLAGIVNRNTQGELLLSPDDPTLPNPMFWLDQLKAAYPQVQCNLKATRHLSSTNTDLCSMATSCTIEP
jgi:hypothetical protein